jgi:hypothetical protein
MAASATRGRVTMAGAATTDGETWVGAAALAAASGALLATCVTVQQHAARIDVFGAGALLLCGSGFVGQQQADRLTPSYAHRYHDAAVIDGARTNVSRITMMRRTYRDYTPLGVLGNARPALGLDPQNLLPCADNRSSAPYSRLVR